MTTINRIIVETDDHHELLEFHAVRNEKQYQH